MRVARDVAVRRHVHYIITPSSSATPRAITELRETLLAPPSRRRPSRRCGLSAALSRRPPLGLAPPSDSALRGGRSSQRAASRSHSPRRGRRPRPRCSSERHARDDGASDRYSGVVSCERRRVRARTLCPFYFFEGRVRILREGARSIVAPGPRANAPSSVSRVECESRGKAPDHDRCATHPSSLGPTNRDALLGVVKRGIPYATCTSFLGSTSSR